MLWELETFAAFSVIHDVDSVERDIDKAAFSTIPAKRRLVS
jgi:hypothetical protein